MKSWYASRLRGETQGFFRSHLDPNFAQSGPRSASDPLDRGPAGAILDLPRPGGIQKVGWPGLVALIVLTLGLALHPLAVDDAFITYRYAHNLATGLGFVYNPGRPVLSTTAPLWALVLAAGAWLGADLPALANALSAIAVGAAALCLLALGRQAGRPRLGALAALFYALHPLLWLTLGLETAAFLALALAAVWAYRSGRLYRTALLLALATLTRADGLILAAVLAVDHLRQTSEVWPDFRCLRRLLGAAAFYFVLMLPLLAWLTWQFGSPLPATLAAKRAQAALGITGFYAHTTYLQGLGILARARLAQTPLYLLVLPVLALGLIALFRDARTGWARLLVAWSAAHLLGYTLLGVTPYYWYYAPLLPGVVALLSLGVVRVGKLGNWEIGHWSFSIGHFLAFLLILALLWSDGAMVRALHGPVPPPEDPVSKVLPEAKGDLYAQAGRWLCEHTPPEALIGVTEVGILGYYSRRPMVDFLGLLEPDVAEALARGDLYWALLHYQPDYLALTAVSPLYAYDLRADPWFQAAYAPVQTFDDPRFWGSPLTVYRRQVGRLPLAEGSDGLPADALRLDAEFGGQIRLLGAVAGADTAQPGDILPLTLYWQATGPVEADYTVFVHLLGRHERVIAQRDAAPGLGARPTGGWTPGQIVADPYLLALPPAAYAPDEAVWEVGLYDAATGRRLSLADGGDNVRFGAVTIRPADEPLRLDFGPVSLTGYDLDRLALSPGETIHVTLHWSGAGPAAVALQLVSEQGAALIRAEGDLSRQTFALTPPADAPPGAYDLELLVADPGTGAALPLLGADGQPQSDRARLTKIRLTP